MRFDFPITSDSSDASRRDWRVFEECTRCHWPMFYSLSSALNTDFCDFPATLARVVDVAVSITRADRGMILLFDERKAAQTKVARSARGQDLPEAELAVSRTIVGRVLRTQKPVVVPNLARDPEFSKADSIRLLELVSAMATPLRLSDQQAGSAGTPQGPLDRERRALSLRAKDQVLGVLYVDSKTTKQTYAEMDLAIFEALANYATTVLLYAQLQEEGRQDPLTGLVDRRHLERSLASEVALAAKSNQQAGSAREPLSLLLVDVDGFREVNRLHGRTVGDDVLRTVGGILRDAVRRSDLPARYGGSTFGVVLPQTSTEGARTTAEKIRKRVQEYEFLGGELAVTLSVGLATVPAHASDAAGLLSRADQALAQAKGAAGNRVLAWQAEGPRADSSAGIVSGDPVRDHDRVARFLHFARRIHADARCLLPELIEAMDAERAFVLRGGIVEGLGRGGEAAKETASTRELMDQAQAGQAGLGAGAAAAPIPGGAIAVEAPPQVRPFDASDLAFLERLAEAAGWVR